MSDATAPRVLLRPWQAKDVPLVLEAGQDRALASMVGIRPGGGTRSAARFLAARQSQSELHCSLVIVDLLDGFPAGEVGFVSDAQSYTGELFYWILPRARRRGLAKIAARMLCEWALGEGHVQVMTAFVSDRNHGSRRVLESAGFHRGARVQIYAGYPGPRDTFSYFRLAEKP